MKLRPYQQDIFERWLKILQDHRFVYLSMEVRTWKTITALSIVKWFWAKKCLFLTKKKAISSILEDYSHFSEFDITVINYESVHKVLNNDFDIIVLDEAHQLGTFPKPNNKFKAIQKRFSHLPMILLSGTLSPESYSQYFHQFFIQKNGVWSQYKNFYRWCDDYVQKKIVYTAHWESTDYSHAHYDMLMEDVRHLILTFTQKEAGFTTKVDEEVMYVQMEDRTYQLIERLKRDKVIDGWEQTVIADTKVKEMQKVHQMYSGTIKFENGTTKCFDFTKWNFIKEKFKDKKIWIFYNFKAEKELLQEVFWDTITDDLDEFNSTDKNIMLQIVSGREWISLKNADILVYYNIAFSNLSYIQSRDRLTTMDRKENKVVWIFSKWWIEEQIYETVQWKKNFTSKIYEKIWIY